MAAGVTVSSGDTSHANDEAVGARGWANGLFDDPNASTWGAAGDVDD
jgi:hypothetical protein